MATWIAMGATTGASILGVKDDWVTVCAISLVAGMIGDVLHEGVGHALVALLTVAPSGTLTAVAWSSAYGSKLVAAGGTLVNLASAGVFWLLLRNSKRGSSQVRLFLLLCCAFNLFTGTGYFFFSGISNFGDWAVVIAGMKPHVFWRILLVVVGILAYWLAAVTIGTGLVRYVGVPLHETRRIRLLTVVPYISSVVLSCLAGLMNPIGLNLVLLSALPASAGANNGLLWMRYYVSKSTVPGAIPQVVSRSWKWIAGSTAMAIPFVFVLGRGITLHR
jgi:hypothetical protein